MFRFIQLFLLAFSLTTALNSVAQRDTVFWFAAPDVSAGVGQTPVMLRFQSYDQPAVITVRQPANGAFVPITLTMPAFSSDSLNLSTLIAQIESPAANVVSNNGIKISSTGRINAVYEVNALANKESFSLKGGKALGTNFYTPFQKFWNTATTTPASYSGIEIVASENNTTVLITPRTAITGHAANATFSVVLNAGQTYSARDMNVTAASSLAGSIVSANKPVAVTLFDGQLTQGACADMIGDQLIPTPSIGTDYAIYKGTSSHDRIYVLATQNASSIQVSGVSTTTTLINSSETLEIPMTEDILYIKSSKPVYVYHVSGFGCELSAAVVPSLNCKGNNNMAFSRSGTDSLGVVLVTRTGYEGNFLLNGSSGLITAAMFQTVPGTSGQYKAARIFFNAATVPANSHNMIVNLADIFTMATIKGGNGNASGASYVYDTDFYATAFSNAGVDDTVCANVNYTLSGNVGGGAVTGAWSSNGYGSFQNGLNSIPNVYVPSPLDTLISPIRIILSSTGFCPIARDTMYLEITPAPIMNANTDQSICENNAVIQLNGIVSGGAVTGIWSTAGTGTFLPNASTLNASYVPSAADIASGTLQFVLTSTNAASCATVTDTMMVDFTPAANVQAGPDTLIVCANNSSVTLTGTVSGPTSTGKWITSGTGIFSPNNSSLNSTYIPSIADTTAGFVWLYLESTSNGNCLPVQDSIYVSINNAPNVDAGPNQLRCANASLVQLNAHVSSPFAGIWSGGNGTFSPSNTALNAIYTPSATEIGNGSVVLTLTSTNVGTCNVVSDAIQINFAAPPFANFSGTSVCEGFPNAFTDFSLPGSGVLTSWSWTFQTGQISTSQNPNYNFGSAGSYPVQLIVSNSNNCRDTVSISVSVYDKPEADFTTVNSCPNNQVTVAFTDASTSSATINYWFYDFGGQGSAAMANVNQQFASGGSYTVTHIVRTTNNCSDTIIRQVVIDPLPDAGFYYNSNGGMNIGAVFNFIDTSDYAVNYSWNFGDGSTSSSANPTHTYYSNGNYYIILEVTNALGCTDSAVRFIAINTVTTEINTLIPTIISPNGDGSNDVWKLEFLQLAYPNVHVEIYNEWGQTIFTSDRYDTPWDGTYNGEPVPDGNYLFMIQLNANASPDIYKGILMVLRKRD